MTTVRPVADLRSLVYVSEATRPLSEAELGALLYAARAYNTRVGVTGILVYERPDTDSIGTFVQCLEGSPEAVRDVFERRVRPASQHHRIVIKRDERIPARQFGEWSMSYDRSEAPAPAGFDALVRRLGPPPR